eukprot:CAMPEP_0177630774 /NCGR_PEP_ID=MMETSP0447-20121125/1389_1 /TAXON_ID=0 /ORGANISM="Stygamoeba regulata, Strain BSH-02190019" /LENGTH=160 /DNA_ID=CAMNT_0019132201 /DNA_START=52 /DNA_END=534 /DNA_ORIENTATION=-
MALLLPSSRLARSCRLAHPPPLLARSITRASGKWPGLRKRQLGGTEPYLINELRVAVRSGRWSDAALVSRQLVDHRRILLRNPLPLAQVTCQDVSLMVRALAVNGEWEDAFRLWDNSLEWFNVSPSRAAVRVLTDTLKTAGQHERAAIVEQEAGVPAQAA